MGRIQRPRRVEALGEQYGIDGLVIPEIQETLIPVAVVSQPRDESNVVAMGGGTRGPDSTAQSQIGLQNLDPGTVLLPRFAVLGADSPTQCKFLLTALTGWGTYQPNASSLANFFGVDTAGGLTKPATGRILNNFGAAIGGAAQVGTVRLEVNPIMVPLDGIQIFEPHSLIFENGKQNVMLTVFMMWDEVPVQDVVG